jgi:hypothetical protein
MSKKTAINLVNSTGLSKTFKKFFHYFSIFTIVLGSNFLTINSANANAVTIADGETDTSFTDADTVSIADTALIDLSGDDQMTSLTNSAATTLDFDTGNGTLTITGAVFSNANTMALTINTGDKVAVGGGVLQTGGGVIDWDIEGSALLTINGSTAVNIESLIDGASNAEGTLAIAGTGLKTFTAAIGTTNIDDITVASGSEGKFSAAVDSEGISVITGTLTVDGALKTDAVESVIGTLNLNNTIIETDGSSASTINLENAAAILNLGAQAAKTMTTTITADAANEGTINVVDASGGAAAGKQIITGVVGLTGARMKIINVGDGSNNGNLELDSATFTKGLAVKSGAQASEASLLTVDAGLTVTDGMTLDDASASIQSTVTFTGNATAATKIDGASAGEGLIVSDNATGVTFSGDIGGTTTVDTVTLDDAGANSVALFDADVNTASGIVLGNDASNRTITATFETQTAATTVTGGISAGDTGDTVTLNFLDVTNTTAPEVVTVSGAVSGFIDAINVGSATVAGAVKFTGDVAATLISVDGGQTDETSNIEFSDMNVTGEVNLDKATADSTVTYSGSAAQTQTGVVHAVDANDGKIVVSNTVGTTFTANIGTDGIVGELEIGATGIGIFEDIVDVLLLDLDGHITIKENNNTATNFTLADGATLVIDDTVVNGEKVFLANTALVAASIVNTGKIQLPSNLSDGQSVELFETVNDGSGVSTLVVEDTNAVLVDTAIRDYVATETGTRDVTVTAVDRTAAEIGTELGSTANDGAALLQATVAASGDATLLDLFTNVLNEVGFSSTADTTLAKQIAPQTDVMSGSSVAAQSVTGSIQGIMSNRMASLRSGDAHFGTGVAAGGMSAQSGFIQVFGSTAEQKKYNSWFRNSSWF